MWEEVYNALYPELLRYAGGICKEPQAAEDLVQETFLKALQTGDLFLDLGPSQRRAWLYRTLKNGLWDRYRRAKVERAYLEGQSPEESYMELGLQRVENEQLLNLLSPQDRMLFTLRYIEGYTGAEIAEMLEMPSGTVRARLCRCRTVLKKQMDL